ncbi:MAG: hypothetical protein SPL13_05425 [Clostridia bacterium]|nr:hypothetical protein [Clostridia bacterium]
MLLTSILVYSALIFPLYLTFYFEYSSKIKSLILKVKFFGILFLKLNIEINSFKIIVKIGNKTLFKINLFSVFTKRNGIKIYKDFCFINFKYNISVRNNNTVLFTTIFFALEYLKNIFLPIIKNRKPYLIIDGKTSVNKGNFNLNFFIKTTISFNLLVVILSIFRTIGGKVFGKK